MGAQTIKREKGQLGEAGDHGNHNEDDTGAKGKSKNFKGRNRHNQTKNKNKDCGNSQGEEVYINQKIGGDAKGVEAKTTYSQNKTESLDPKKVSVRL